ncbi:RNA polymerase subunit sigma-24 [Embleya scabrispora]|uniref:RNA polymerase subunit sigma-24 n=1 Tax=Embleya scabrispora TaxID=159449 RepID=A0A1T3P8D3_9ACTN|nr:RNA polymerase sigma factor [Embleya scabrispora]OPC85283.1 RNA polymerase subunit sigma-24 [Embleya scabrispora]
MTEDSTDTDLLAAVAAGRQEALRILHTRHAPWLRARLARRCADADLVDDAIQDTFVAVWRGAGRFDPAGGEPAAWIWTIGIRRLVSLLRVRRIPAIELHADHATTASAEDLVLLGVEHTDVGDAIARLSPELRAVIEATVLDGLSTGEAARLLGIPQGTVKTRAMRARARLRELLT